MNTGGFSAGSGKAVPRRDDPGDEPMLPDVGVAMQGVDLCVINHIKSIESITKMDLDL